MGKSQNPEVVKRTLRIQRAVFRKKTATLADILNKRRPKCKKAKAIVRKLEAEIKELGGELSDEVSSCDSLLGETSSESENKDESSSDSSSSSTNAADEVPVTTKKGAKAKPAAAKNKEEGKQSEGSGKGPPEELAEGPSKKVTRRGKDSFPVLAPGDPAPNHRGKPDAGGVLYPGFPVGHPQRCDTCEVLRRGFSRTGKKHNENCRWRSRGVRPKDSAK
ncbi:TY4B-H [Symbiodinium sp. CCMP2592]|nr:TY4B-H [Symbiodinium sp. CCMP2592]